jgi:hypothetical protein
MKFLLLACALAMFSPAVRAADFKMDGKQLRDDCKNSDTGSGYNEGKCIAFVIGVDAGYQMDRGVDGMQSHVCMPEGVTYGQMVKVVVKYLNDHPEELHHPAALLTLNALIGAFPCPWDSTKPKK